VGAERAAAQAMVAPDADGGLIHRLQQGDAAAHADLYRRFGARLHRFAASRLAGDQDLADDVVVQTLVDAARNIRRFNPRKSNLSAWLHGIARHRIQREQRSRRRSKSVPASAQVPFDAMPNTAAAGDTDGDLAARLDASQRVAQLAQLLSPVEMEVLVLRCVGEFSTKEIAGILRRSERAVETLLHRAKHKAREGLGKHAD
jgi:RNA polymerase sigma factor (sigma-70 family)